MRKFLIASFAAFAFMISFSTSSKAQLQESAFQNILVCGDFTTCPWQRGTAFAAIANTATMTADYWTCIGAAGSSIAASQQAATGFPSVSLAFQMLRTAANADVNAIHCGQVVESLEAITMQGQTLCFSVNTIKGANFSSANNVLTANIITGTGTNQGYASMVAGTWTGQATLQSNAITVSSSWNYTAPICVQVPTTATEIGVDFTWTPVGTAGAADSIQLAQVSLQVVTPVPGVPTVAAPFERRPLWLELSLAQRRAWIIAETNTVGWVCTVTGANVFSCPLATPVQMRAAPTATLTTLGGYSVVIDGAAAAALTGGAGGTGNVNTCVFTGTNAVTAAVHMVTLRGTLTTGRLTCSADLT